MCVWHLSVYLGLQQGKRQDVGPTADELPLEVPPKNTAASRIACAADYVGICLCLLVYKVQNVLGLHRNKHRLRAD